MAASLALFASFLLLTYLVIPAGLFRLFAGAGLPLKIYHKNRVQEIIFAAVVCSLPFFFTLFLTWCVPPFNAWPLSVRTWEKNLTRREAYKTLAAATLKRDLETKGDFWAAATQVERRQIRFLFWYWLLAGLEARVYVFLMRKRCLRNKPYLDELFSKGLSDWKILYPHLNKDSKEKLSVLLDVRTGEDDLVKGKMNDCFMNTEGELTGLLLQDPVRRKRTSDAPAGVRSWRYIPGRYLYVPLASVTDMNIRYVTDQEYYDHPAIAMAIDNYLRSLLSAKQVENTSIRFRQPVAQR